ncbi:MAG: hypothetical protein QM696_06495 [Steroidobacteraceae bacterium]
MKPPMLIRLLGLAALAFSMTQAQAQDPAPIRIGIVLPEAQLGQGNSGQDVAEPVRQLLMSYLAGPRLELIPLQARIAAQVEAEAQQQNCAYLLYTRVAQKKAGKGFGSALKMLGPAASMLPGLGGMAGMGGMMAGMAGQVAATAAMQSAQQDAMARLTQAQSGTVKARDEISLAYRVIAAGTTKPVLDETLKAKAEQDGENLLRPLAEQVATKTLGTLLAPQG